MNKKIAAALAAGALLFSAASVFAGAKNATYLEWTWPAGVHKDAYFMRTGSGIVHGWTYGHPTHGDARFIYKPLEKFTNAASEGCDEGYLFENTSWQSQNLYNVMDTVVYEDAFDTLFDRPALYLLCIYEMD